MASPTLPAESVFTHAVAFSDSPDEIIPPSQQLPAENPPHSRVSSKDAISPKTQAPATFQSIEAAPSLQATKPRTPGLRGKSNSLSFPVLVKAVTNPLPVPTERKPSHKPKSSLRIHVPQSSDTSFLTSLAAQERQVLELKEELSKAEESLTRLKSQWASHESRRRDSEARRLHRMKPMGAENPQTPGIANFTGASPMSKEMFQEMQRRTASMDQTKRPVRRRRFSGSRQMRALSLVSPDALAKFAEHARQQSQGRRSVEKAQELRSPVLLDSPSHMPPTPDLIHEEDEDGTEATSSQRSSESPKQPRHAARSSMQMAADFRDGLWTFFEDLKQATYGEDARGPDARPRGGSKSDAQLRREMHNRSAMQSGVKGQKRHVKRQTWQIRPNESRESLVDVGGHQHNIPNKQTSPKRERPSMVRTSTTPAQTPQKVPFYEKEVDGEVWQTWDTPRSASASASRSTTPVPPPSSSRASSIDPATRKLVSEDGRRGSLPWPALNKLKPGQLTRTASHLMDEWEKSLSPPPAYQQVQQIQRCSEDGRTSPRPSSPRPPQKRANSRLDLTYS